MTFGLSQAAPAPRIVTNSSPPSLVRQNHEAAAFLAWSPQAGRLLACSCRLRTMRLHFVWSRCSGT